MACTRWHSKKKWTVAFTPSFHGRTMGSLSMTDSNPVARKRFEPFLPVEHAPYPYVYRFKNEDESECSNNSLNAVGKIFKKHRGDVASVFFEPISGEGGYIVPPKNFARGLKQLCAEYGALFCVDEVQSGCFRTGKFLAVSNFGVVPDIVCMSKAIGGGVPLGATIARNDLMDWERGVHEEFEIIGDVRGLGLMIGVELVKTKKSKKPAIKELERVLSSAGDNGLLLLHAGKNVIRVCPPLILSKEQALEGLEILRDSLKKVRVKE
ncbi:MAG: aminotransferase class III-fold pyridoxal phosphate-dependent enzyme [Candidatus Diapherotrites archaeon]|nr:aminotransferase class III-fold pyridoxal phosphate-dependent enzyme [Candidatus Diapherotrites archaeon]